MNPHEIYQSVTNTIIELLENHAQNWDKPWLSLGQDNDYARNPKTGKYYRGINQFLLSFQLMRKGYLKNVGMTLNQIQDMQGQVLKGEKVTPVIFYKSAWIDRIKKYYPPEAVKTMSMGKMESFGIAAIPVLKLYRVFNVAQNKGLLEEYYQFAQQPLEELKDFEKEDRAEDLIKSTGATVDVRLFNEAFYDRSADKIVLPLREQFKDQAQPFYATALHELAH